MRLDYVARSRYLKLPQVAHCLQPLVGELPRLRLNEKVPPAVPLGREPLTAPLAGTYSRRSFCPQWNQKQRGKLKETMGRDHGPE